MWIYPIAALTLKKNWHFTSPWFELWLIYSVQVSWNVSLQAGATILKYTPQGYLLLLLKSSRHTEILGYFQFLFRFKLKCSLCYSVCVRICLDYPHSAIQLCTQIPSAMALSVLVPQNALIETIRLHCSANTETWRHPPFCLFFSVLYVLCTVISNELYPSH